MRFREGIGTIEIYNNPDGTLACSLMMDLPKSLDPAVAEEIRDVQFGFLHAFLHDKDELAYTGSIFRDGMRFQMTYGQSRDDGGDWRNGPDDPEPPPPEPIDDELMKPVKEVEKFLKDGKGRE